MSEVLFQRLDPTLNVVGQQLLCSERLRLAASKCFVTKTMAPKQPMKEADNLKINGSSLRRTTTSSFTKTMSILQPLLPHLRSSIPQQKWKPIIWRKKANNDGRFYIHK